MDLTDNEKRDAVKLIEAGKPLPDKYCFLLFGDDRNLELKTPFHECKPGRYMVAVKVVDIFGNGTMKIVEVSV